MAPKPAPRRPPQKKTAPKPIDQTATAPPTPKRHQVSIEVDAAEFARIERCAQDAAFHGGATVTKPTVVRKALWAYLQAYESDPQS